MALDNDRMLDQVIGSLFMILQDETISSKVRLCKKIFGEYVDLINSY